jgi:peptide/nickel transport system ATP-binding protein
MALSVDPQATTPDVDAGGPLLSVSDVSVTAHRGEREITLVDGVSFELEAGRTVGLVGESGSGKTLTALSVIQHLPVSLRSAGGTVSFGGRDLTALSPAELRAVRGNDIGVIFQDPLASFDPSFTVGSQMVETIRTHTSLSRAEARELSVSLLDRVGIAQPDRRMRDYAHQLSGGMAQRVMIAMAISCRPRLLIADEPTTALDVTVQAQILALLRSLQEEHGMAVLLISHDLSVIAEMADDMVVMYAGQVVERGDVVSTFERPTHPYTEALLGAQPAASARGQDLVAIPGSVPSAGDLPPGCRFHPRCPHAADACREGDPQLVVLDAGETRCLRHGELTLAGVPDDTEAAAPEGPELRSSDRHSRSQERNLGESADTRPVLVEAKGLTKDFTLRTGRWPWSKSTLRAVDDVSFVIHAGETLGLVGESGAGKSTVGRIVLGLVAATGGEVLVDGTDMRKARGRRKRDLRRDVQVVFQNPHSSLDPMMTVGDTLAEPLEVHTDMKAARVTERVHELLDQVGLDADYADRYPDALSGGQRQRIAIARALALEPKLIVCDEPVSALDVSTQAQVVNLLADLQRKLGVAYLFVGHDLSVMYQVSDRVAVMYRGRIVEIGPSEQIYHEPRHAYTRSLLGAVLSIDPRRRRLADIAAAAADRSFDGPLPEGSSHDGDQPGDDQRDGDQRDDDQRDEEEAS